MCARVCVFGVGFTVLHHIFNFDWLIIHGQYLTPPTVAVMSPLRMKTVLQIAPSSEGNVPTADEADHNIETILLIKQ